MKICLDHIGKRYQYHWVFRQITARFQLGESWAVLGNNGSGKSTLLRIMAQMQTASEGTVHFYHKNQLIPSDKAYKYVSFVAPGLELIEEFTLKEFLAFHFRLKPMMNGYSIARLMEMAGLAAESGKRIDRMSSGMKQRVKLLQAIFTDIPFLFMDEPCSNLDQQGIDSYMEWVRQVQGQKLIIVASNDPQEYTFCAQTIQMMDFKS